ncbi:hypothetical protein D3C74_186380 [compost metagenome]
MRKILIIFFCCFLVFPVSAFATISETSEGSKQFLLTNDEYFVDIPEGSTGTFTLKTKSGSSVYKHSGKKIEWVKYVFHLDKGTASEKKYDFKITYSDGTSKSYEDSSVFGAFNILGTNFKKTTSLKSEVTVKTGLDSALKVYLSQYQLDTGTGTVDATFPVQWNNGTRRLTWSTYPENTYEIVVTDPAGTTYNISPSTKVFKVESDSGGTYKLQARTLNGDVLSTVNIYVPDIGGGTDPDPGEGSGGTDPNPVEGECFCEAVCEVLPEILAGFGSDLNLIRGDLENLNGQMAPIHDALGRIWDATDTLHRDNLRMENVMTQIRNDVAPLHSDLLTVHYQLDGILRQITPTQNYENPSPVRVPEYYRPGEASPSYKNNQTYFTDQGDAATPDAMPAAPEPVNWEFEGQRLIEDAVINQSPEMTQDTVMQRENEMTQDAVMQHENEMTQDAAMERENEMTKDAEMQRMPELDITTPLKVQDNYYPLRWDSSEYAR